MLKPHTPRFSLLLMTILSISSQAGAFSSGPPAGSTGSIASAGNSCAQAICHTGATGSGGVEILGAPGSYEVSAIYDLRVRIHDAAQLAAGFQLSVEDASGAHVGTLIVTDAVNTALNFFSPNWIQHTFTGFSNSFTNWDAAGQAVEYAFQWRAPSADAGNLTFWAAGNAVNHDFFNTFDHVYLANTTTPFGCGNDDLDPGEECDPPGNAAQCPGGEVCSSSCTCPSAAFDFAADSFEVTGNRVFFDDFEDGLRDSPPTDQLIDLLPTLTTESGGFLHLRDGDGTLDLLPFALRDVVVLSPGISDFGSSLSTVTASFRPDIPNGENQGYGIVTSDESATEASFLGVFSLRGIDLSLFPLECARADVPIVLFQEEDFTLLGCDVIENPLSAITGNVVLRLEIDHFSNLVVPSYSVDGGATWIPGGIWDRPSTADSVYTFATVTYPTIFAQGRPLCGNGIEEGSEECDDGNLSDHDGCNSACQVEDRYDCQGEPSVCTFACGDGVINLPGEECDQGLGTPGDPVPADSASCDADCTLASCGDGYTNTAADEECDGGDRGDGDCCSSSCQIEPPGTVCRPSADACDPAETCDGFIPLCPRNVVDTGCFTPPPVVNPPRSHFFCVGPSDCPASLEGSLDQTLPTIVLTHGLQPGLGDDVDPDPDKLWTGFQKSKTAAKLIKDDLISRRRQDEGDPTIDDPGVNIVQYVWRDAFQDGGPVPLLPDQVEYIHAHQYVPDAGTVLASELLRALQPPGQQYVESIHFIGHSLGTAVNAYAAKDFLKLAAAVPRAQFTALDRPHHINDIPPFESFEHTNLSFGSSWFRTTLATTIERMGQNLRIENYYALDGTLMGGAVNAGLGDVAEPDGPIYNHKPDREGLRDPLKLEKNGILPGKTIISPANNHTGVHQWYRWTIDPDIESPLQPVIGPPCSGGEFNLRYTSRFLPLLAFFPLHASLSPCEQGWYWALNGPNPDAFPRVETRRPSPISRTALVLRDFQASGSCALQSASAVSCTASSSPFGMAVVDIPDDAEFLEFEYQFSDVGLGDYAAVFIDNNLLWLVSASSVAQEGEFSSSGPIPIADFRGSRNLTVALYGISGANIEFIAREFSTIPVRLQSKPQQKCINALNKNLAKVAKVQGKDMVSCIKDFAKAKSLTPASTLEDCLTTDRKGKVAKSKAKTGEDSAKKCSDSLPDFAATDPNTVNNAAVQKELDLIHDIFGSDLDVVIATEAIAIDKPRSKCQQAVAKAVQKCQDAKLREFNKCKKIGLKDESVQSRDDLADCMGDDPKGKIAKTCDPTKGKIRSTIDKKCGSVDFPGAFPQVVAIPGCGTDDPATLATCLDQIVECQVCLALNQADTLARDCDDFDDGVVNGSCP